MNNIEKAKAYLNLIPDDIRKEPNQMIEIIESLVEEIELKDKVIEAAKEFIDTNVSDWKAQDAAYDKFEEALSQLKETE
jgi:hemerythrin-like domain-containing protein